MPRTSCEVGRKLPPEILRADQALVRASVALDWMAAATPVDAAGERVRFAVSLEAGGVPEPRYTYRKIAVPGPLRSELLGHLSSIEPDSSPLAACLARKIRETLLVADLVEAVGTPRFAAVSATLFGEPVRRVIRIAREWANGSAVPEEREVPAEGPDSLASALSAEMRHYGIGWPVRRDRRFAATVVLRQGALVLGGAGWVSREERDRLCAHEVGVHLVAVSNALAHPLGLFALGTAGYLADHEGAAICAEEARGTLSQYRRALLGARALAAAAALAGEPQGELGRRLVDEHGLSPWDAAVAAERGYRGGGLAKDLCYLSGYERVRAALRTLDLGAFLSGRMSLDDVALVRALIDAGVLPAPRRVSRELAASTRASGQSRWTTATCARSPGRTTRATVRSRPKPDQRTSRSGHA
ncbi:MAG: DUF1704 domain-containing protein [Deltaproteobacteria bacterium]|nr:DUF1704 domain-containing protein [Deltaproteobacteria bacterium]